ncbi:MAG: hypothetical protein EBW87_04010 [Burkholderiaceae bacterium]|nr:hypothetical protein [Burkholderiaceae bacterium]
MGICHVGGGGGCPAYGTVLEVLTGVEYPIAEGGESVMIYPDSNATYVPIQVCDVTVKADGSCGSFTDWTTATNVSYKAEGTSIGSDSPSYYRGPIADINIEVNCSLVGSFSPGTIYYVFVSDGGGGFSTSDMNNYYGYGDDYGLNNPYTVNGPGCDTENPIEVSIYWDGNGGYYS